MRIGIVKGLSGNLASVRFALQRIGFAAEYVTKPEAVAGLDRVILPGVGSFTSGMRHLQTTGLSEAVIEYATRGRPLLGICLGAQLLFDRGSEDGGAAGFGLIQGEIVRFDDSQLELPVPHTGWNFVSFSEGLDSPFVGLSGHYYFNHSYRMQVTREEDVFGWTNYGDPFPAAVRVENIVGYQFHPEKSQDLGLLHLSRFIHFGEKWS